MEQEKKQQTEGIVRAVCISERRGIEKTSILSRILESRRMPTGENGTARSAFYPMTR